MESIDYNLLLCSNCEINLENNVYEIFEHPKLAIPLCICCHDLVSSNENRRDITEDVCSICLEGGELFLCGGEHSTCSNVFCGPCIQRLTNLELQHPDYLETLRAEDSEWTCFVCDPSQCSNASKTLKYLHSISMYRSKSVLHQMTQELMRKRHDWKFNTRGSTDDVWRLQILRQQIEYCEKNYRKLFDSGSNSSSQKQTISKTSNRTPNSHSKSSSLSSSSSSSRQPSPSPSSIYSTFYPFSSSYSVRLDSESIQTNQFNLKQNHLDHDHKQYQHEDQHEHEHKDMIIQMEVPSPSPSPSPFSTTTSVLTPPSISNLSPSSSSYSPSSSSSSSSSLSILSLSSSPSTSLSPHSSLSFLPPSSLPVDQNLIFFNFLQQTKKPSPSPSTASSSSSSSSPSSSSSSSSPSKDNHHPMKEQEQEGNQEVGGERGGEDREEQEESPEESYRELLRRHCLILLKQVSVIEQKESELK